MSNQEPLSKAQREWLDGCREEVEQAEAHLFAAQAPEAWVDTGVDGADFDVARAASDFTLEPEVAEELLTPLDAGTRSRIADEVLGSYLAETGDKAPAIAPAANDAGRRRQWWPLPMTAVAAVLLTLLYVDLRGSAGAPPDVFDGSTVLLSPTTRSGPQRPDPAETLTIRSGEKFDIHCEPKGREVKIVGIVAEPTAGGEARLLGARPIDGPDGASWKVYADLEPGTAWSVSCQAQDRSSGHTALLGPPATLNVKAR